MIVWSGWGFVTAIFAFLGVLAVSLLAPGLPKEYSVPLGLLIAAGANFFVAKWVDDPARGRELIDPKTNQRVILKTGASLFFIPIRYWTYILAAIAILLLVAALGGARTVT